MAENYQRFAQKLAFTENYIAREYAPSGIK